MEEQLGFNLESCSPNGTNNQQETKITTHKNPEGKDFLGLLTNSEKRIKLKPLSLERKAKEKQLSGIKSLKEETLEAKLPEKEQFFDNLISVKTVAEWLGVAPKTVHNWVYLRKLPFVKCGQKVMFRQRSLKAWLNRKEVKSWL